MGSSPALRTSGLSISSLLGVLFIGLKLGNVIDWSWWWVLSPFWVAPAIALSVLMVGLLLAALVAAVS